MAGLGWVKEEEIWIALVRFGRNPTKTKLDLAESQPDLTIFGRNQTRSNRNPLGLDEI